MADEFRYFGTMPLTLLVGPDEQQLPVPRGLLSQTPFFTQALMHGPNNEPGDKKFTMPHFDAAALSDDLYFCWTGRVTVSQQHRISGKSTETRRIAKARVKTYITAEKTALSRMQEGIERQLIIYRRTHGIDPDNFLLLYKAELHTRLLYKFVIVELDYQLHRKNLSDLDEKILGLLAA